MECLPRPSYWHFGALSKSSLQCHTLVNLLKITISSCHPFPISAIHFRFQNPFVTPIFSRWAIFTTTETSSLACIADLPWRCYKRCERDQWNSAFPVTFLKRKPSDGFYKLDADHADHRYGYPILAVLLASPLPKIGLHVI